MLRHRDVFTYLPTHPPTTYLPTYLSTHYLPTFNTTIPSKERVNRVSTINTETHIGMRGLRSSGTLRGVGCQLVTILNGTNRLSGNIGTQLPNQATFNTSGDGTARLHRSGSLKFVLFALCLCALFYVLNARLMLLLFVSWLFCFSLCFAFYFVRSMFLYCFVYRFALCI
jgi:hypothetical protein